ncbi:thermonuclease family protein [Rhizobium sp. 42MFCr.1]|uniref:thermonuclease family protein n=1 Tax=Rhizobium sp. 42MFCr.1 TaxID=1048680 RepID=UPI00036B20A7|nr:thermonuclease family protein [Rhizobium sp. 42MFCr.1]
METASNLKRDIEIALRDHHLNDWQRRFLTDILTRIDRSGDRFTLTDKQWRKIFEILADHSNVVQFQFRETLPRHPRSPKYPRSKFAKRRSHRLTWNDRRFLTAIVVLALIASLQFFSGSKFAAVSLPSSSTRTEFVSSTFSVTDGDTIHVEGESNGTRLVGYNAPEVFSPRCTFEKELGDRATDRLKELVAAGPVELARVSCACERGTEGTDRCNYGRSCAVLYAGGRNVSNILVGEGLAVPFVCSETKCPQTPRPWCGR